MEDIQKSRLSIQKRFEKICQEGFKQDIPNINDQEAVQDHFNRMIRLLGDANTMSSDEAVEYFAFIRKEALRSYYKFIKQ